MVVTSIWRDPSCATQLIVIDTLVERLLWTCTVRGLSSSSVQLEATSETTSWCVPETSPETVVSVAGPTACGGPPSRVTRYPSGSGSAPDVLTTRRSAPVGGSTGPSPPHANASAVQIGTRCRMWYRLEEHVMRSPRCVLTRYRITARPDPSRGFRDVARVSG